ncbi:hypothetical protein [Pseudomonas aeruginosa]|uniref:hypothetical protein n=1 Tax=Pseudomonas aeruginosa TaxID=287 RepID=UPI000F848A56|nr:hypothetical protein [Pseudomonas aeruginosa]RTT49349.1 hypothetical protein DY958_11770 [Pseudomonas aeruginosa]
MQKYSMLVLLWLFGSWIFAPGEIPAEVMAESTELSPLTIFASYFSVVGLAAFGILSSWAMFLGIFRLRQNGNFFGVRDGNEAFFYPLRVVTALILCAPVIPVGSSQHSSQIVLTPGHSLIAGIAKSGSSMGDDAQVQTFKLMHEYNLFTNPGYKPPVKESESLRMIKNWSSLAYSAAGYFVHKNPHDLLKDLSSEQIATLLIESKWRTQYTNPSSPAYYGHEETNHPIITAILNHTNIPLIPPNDKIAAAIMFTSSELDGSAAGELSTEYELASESKLCSWLGSTSFTCSDEINSLRAQNDKAISVALAKAQRELWIRQYTTANSVNSTIFDLTYEQERKLASDINNYYEAEAKWYTAVVKSTIQSKLIDTNLKASEDFFSSLEQWGWMMGGTFVLRSANDFTRAQESVASSTSKLYPTTSLASITSGDDLTKIAQGKLELSNERIIPNVNIKELLGLNILEDDPTKANLHTVSGFGREIAGTGLMLISGRAAGKLLGFDGFLSKVLVVIGIVLLIAGAMIGYVLPLFFAVSGLMGVITWLTFVSSAFFGVTLWGAAQAAPKGEEHTSQMAGKGWNTLIFIWLYPALAVGGLAAAVTITGIGLPIVNTMMAGAWGMLDNGVADLTQPFDAVASLLIGSVMMVLLTCMLFWSVSMVSASLITNFPRTVLNMISFSEPGLNPYENTAQGIMGSVSGMVKAPLSMATQALTRRFVGAFPRTPQAGG